MAAKKIYSGGPRTKMEVAFVAIWSGNHTDAARQLGMKHPNVSGPRMANRPHVRVALEKKQAVMIQKSGEDLVRGVSITRNDIINRLDRLSIGAESEAARVSALAHLANIFGLNPKHADTDLFAGWTDDELEHYRETGELPARFGPALGSSESSSGNSNSPSQ